MRSSPCSCWMAKYRDNVTGELLASPHSFPHGMKALGDMIHGKGLKYGLYSDRGFRTCQARKRYFLATFDVKIIILPRQTQDKHRKHSKKNRFLTGVPRAAGQRGAGRQYDGGLRDRLLQGTTRKRYFLERPLFTLEHRTVAAPKTDVVSQNDGCYTTSPMDEGAENAFFWRHLYTKNDHFAKTGLGQTRRKLRANVAFRR